MHLVGFIVRMQYKLCSLYGITFDSQNNYYTKLYIKIVRLVIAWPVMASKLCIKTSHISIELFKMLK